MWQWCQMQWLGRWCEAWPFPRPFSGGHKTPPPQRADAAVIAAHGAIIAAVHLASGVHVSGGVAKWNYPLTNPTNRGEMITGQTQIQPLFIKHSVGTENGGAYLFYKLHGYQTIQNNPTGGIRLTIQTFPIVKKTFTNIAELCFSNPDASISNSKCNLSPSLVRESALRKTPQKRFGHQVNWNWLMSTFANRMTQCFRRR